MSSKIVALKSMSEWIEVARWDYVLQVLGVKKGYQTKQYVRKMTN